MQINPLWGVSRVSPGMYYNESQTGTKEDPANIDKAQALCR